MKRALIVFGVIALLYPLVLLVLGWAATGRVEEQIKQRLSHTLRADEVSIDDIDVGLIRGKVTLHGIRAKRTGLGTASIEVATLEVDVAPMGWALINSDPTRLEVVGAHLDLSAAGVATLRTGTDLRDIQVEEFVMHNSRITMAVTSLFPSLGQAELSVAHARAQDVELSNALSWLYKTNELDATLRLPGPMEFVAHFDGEALSVSGSVLGSMPITIPFSWPIPDPRELELSQILSLTKHLVTAFGPELAKRKAKDMWDDVVDAL